MKQLHIIDHHSDYTIKWATLDWEIEQAFALRRKIFCEEQGIFTGDDRDKTDDHAQCLVAIANHGGWHDQVVGTVRIHHEGENVWWGSRLGVDPEFRTQVGLGAALIKLAVSSAHALGCEKFLAQVQKKNERLFNRLRWESCFELDVRNRPHVMMEADLNNFPPIYHPNSGFVLKERKVDFTGDLAPSLLTILPFANAKDISKKVKDYPAANQIFKGKNHAA